MAHDLNKMDNSSYGGSGEVALIQEEEKVVDAVLLNMSTKPRLPKSFNNLPTKPRLKALKQIVYAPQPIKCVEAVFVALYLTAGLLDVERVPLGFKTDLHGQVYQHIVLLVQHGGRWGAFGISRCPDLMHKDLVFDCMSSVIENFKTAYESQGHILLKIRIGLPVEHDITSPNFVCWRHLNLNLKYTSWAESIDAIDKHAAKAKRLWDLWVLSGKGDDPCKSSALRKAPLDNKAPPSHDTAKKKKKKKLASRDATPTHVKPSIVTCSTIGEASSSSRASSFEVADSTSKEDQITSKAPAAAASSSPESSGFETTVIAACPGIVGNSTFRVSKTSNKNHGASLETMREVAKPGTKFMRVAVPTSTVGAKIDQVLAVSRGILKTKYCRGTQARNAGNFASSSSPSGSHLNTRVSRRQSAADPLYSRIPVRISYQTFDARVLLPKSSRVSRVG